MSQKSSSARPPDPAKRPSPVQSLVRLRPYVKPALPRIVLGMVAALLAAVVALLIPLVLQLLVDGPLSSGDRAQVWPAFAIVLALSPNRLTLARLIVAGWRDGVRGRQGRMPKSVEEIARA